MSTVNWIQLAIEGAMIIAGLLALYWRQRVENEHRFTKLETLVGGLGEDHKELNGQIENLHGRVGGISRAVAEIKGKLSQ